MLQKPNDNLPQKLDSKPYRAAVEYYASCLTNNDQALDFLSEKYSMDGVQASQYQAGFVDRTLGPQLPTRDSQSGRKLRDKLIEFGLLKRTGHETLRGCVTFPLFDAGGKITGIYGHRIDKHGKGNQELLIGSGSLDAPIESSLVSYRQANAPHESVSAENANTESAAPPTKESAEATESDASSNAEQQYECPPIEPIAEPPRQLPAQPESTPKPESMPAQPESTPKPESMPSQPSSESEDGLIIEDEQLKFTRGDRHYRIRGLEKNMSVCQLKVNIMASRDDLVHLDTLDLVKARARTSFIKATASELYAEPEIVKKDIGQLLLKLELLREQQIAEAKTSRVKVVELTEQEQHEALELLRAPNLLDRIVADMDACGIVGESTNKLTGYLAAVSRKLERPLAILIQSSSSAGKTSVMDAILAMVPGEDQHRFSAMSGQSLFYLEHDAIKHKVLAISEDEGIAEATYALKLLQSEGELRQAVVGKTSDGRMGTQEYYVEGPTQIFLTTTAEEIDEELYNRCMVLTVDETRQQTDAIHHLQRAACTVDAKAERIRINRLRNLHQNAQRLLRPIEINNPYAQQLTFANDKTRLRRDHQKYLTLINTVTFLQQHQRQVYSTTIDGQEIDYINVEPSDISIANDIAGRVLGQSLDELAPQTRNLLMQLHDFVTTRAKELSVDRCAFRFTRRDVREAIGWSDFQLRTHLKRLVKLEFVLVHRGKHGRQYVYELFYCGQGQQGQPFLMGLLDPSKLKPVTTRTPSTRKPTSSIGKRSPRPE